MNPSAETTLMGSEGDLLTPVLEHYWHPVAYGHELGTAPLGVTLLDRRLVVFRDGGRLVALGDRCLHRSAALSLGRIVDGTVECPYHGWRWDAGGRCVHVPAAPARTGSVKGRVPVYKACEAAGMIWVCLGEPRLPPPEFPELADAGYRVLCGPTYDWKTSAARRLENFCDFAHFSFLHEGSLGSRGRAEVQAVELWREAHVLRARRSGVLEPNVSQKKKLLGIEESWIAPVNEYHITPPHTVHLKRIFPNGKRYVLIMAASPVSSNLTRSFWYQARDFGVEAEHDDFFIGFEKRILAEDVATVESQDPYWIPLRSGEVSLDPADQISIAYRRALLELVQEDRRRARA